MKEKQPNARRIVSLKAGYVFALSRYDREKLTK